MSSGVKVSSAQIKIEGDEKSLIKKYSEIIAQSSENGSKLILFPEYTNVAPGPGITREAMYKFATDFPGTFSEALSSAARKHDIYVAANLTIKGKKYPELFNQTILFSPEGRMTGYHQKMHLIVDEWDVFEKGQKNFEVYPTDVGRIGMYICMDGVTPESSRVLALNKAQILLNSVCTPAFEEMEYIVPARAIENMVWVISSHRVGKIGGEDPNWSTKSWVGGSMIVSPRGEILAKASLDKEEIIYATIQPEEADNKMLGQDNNLFQDRRSDLYNLLSKPTSDLPLSNSNSFTYLPQNTVKIGCIQVNSLNGPHKALARSLELSKEVATSGAQVIVLPELFLFDPLEIKNHLDDSVKTSLEALREFQMFCSSYKTLATLSLVESQGSNFYSTVYLVGSNGAVLSKYRQIHLWGDERAWAKPGDTFCVAKTDYGSFGLMLGYDNFFPEMARTLAFMGADAILLPTCWKLSVEPEFLIKERASENHLCIAVANRNDSPVMRGSMIIPVRTPFQSAGNLGSPHFVPGTMIEFLKSGGEMKHGEEGYVVKDVNLELARSKVVAHKTDLVKDRRYEFYGDLSSATEFTEAKLITSA